MLDDLFKLPDVPDSIDKAIENITDKPTKVLGRFIADWLYLRFGNTMYKASKARILHDAELKTFIESISAKAEEIPEDKRCAPAPAIVSRALDGAIQTDPHSKVRELFSNLIASSMHEDLSIHNHVAFIEIAKQLSSTDAHIFKIISQKQRIPICKAFTLDDLNFAETMRMFDDAGYPIEEDAFVQFPNLSGIDVSMHYTLLDKITVPHFQAEQSIDNLSRLGLISLDYTTTLPGFSYEPFKELPDIIAYLSESPSDTTHRLVPGVCSMTRFGKTFATVCIN